MIIKRLVLSLGFSGLAIAIAFQFYKLNKLDLEPTPIGSSVKDISNFELSRLDGQSYTNLDLP